ncbi:MAG: hypothetical protein HYX40_05900 [Sphingobacteriales bacterium]|nr:hypothetical protein [Sphingobacteriales bacterium]
MPRILEILLISEDQTSHFYAIVWKTLASIQRFLTNSEKEVLNQFGQAYYFNAKLSNDKEKVEMALLDLEEAGLTFT